MEMIFWGVFFILGWIGGLLMRSRSIGRLEGECWRLRKIYHEQVRTISGLERDVKDEQRKRDKHDGRSCLDGVRIRVGSSGGIFAGKTFSLKKINR